MTCDEYKDTVQMCRDGVRKAKASQELDLMKDVKGNKRSVYGYFNRKRKMDLLLIWSRVPADRGHRKC